MSLGYEDSELLQIILMINIYNFRYVFKQIFEKYGVLGFDSRRRL
jgi:hypothetical protein